MIRIFFLFLSCPFFLSAQTPTQTLRGTVVDGISMQALPGATIVLPDTKGPLAAVTDEEGHFILSDVPVGRYRMRVDYLGYATLYIGEILVEAGRETVQEIQLKEQTESLWEVTVRAQGRGSSSYPVSLHTLTVEEQFRYPASFFDPARVATSYPGVAAPDDQANHLSIRGNSPTAVRWRLEGVDIVNPNHTANAGTFSDRPSSAGGGVSILSAQVLDVSNFLTGAFPSGYGNSIGGVMDMHFRKGNDQRRQYVLQAGVIGLEAAAEGPFKSRQSQAPESGQASFLLNYRYSFTGLLTSFGVDFGGEEIGFQDVSFYLNFPTKNAGDFGVFGVGGKSENIFTSPRRDVVEEKELFDIDFQSKMGVVGISHVLPTGKKSVLRTVGALSGLEHERTSLWVVGVSEPLLWDKDDITQRKLSVSSIFSQKIRAGHQFRIGLMVNQEKSNFFTFANDFLGASTLLAGTVEGWLVQPFAEWQKSLADRWELTAGAHLSHFTFSGKTFIEPRAVLSFSATEKSKFNLAYGLHSQSQLPQTQALSTEGSRLSPTRSHHTVLGFQRAFSAGRILSVEIYYQSLFDVPTSQNNGSVFSAINLTEFTAFKNETLRNNGSARNYGLDYSVQKHWSGGTYVLVSGSLYRSQFTPLDGEERSTRWDGRYLLSASGGREWTKSQEDGKVKIWGLGLRFLRLGGFREQPLDLDASKQSGRTLYDLQADFSEKLKDYFRIDLRIYRKWERPSRSSILSLDIQNASNRKNNAFTYFDQATQEVTVRQQLSLIPVLNWRMEFQ